MWRLPAIRLPYVGKTVKRLATTLILLGPVAVYAFIGIEHPRSQAGEVRSYWAPGLAWSLSALLLALLLRHERNYIGRLSARSHGWLLLIALVVTIWILSGGASVELVVKSLALRESVGAFDLFTEVGIWVGALFGLATIYGLLIAIGQIQEYVRPRGMSFRETLEQAKKFVDDRKRTCTFILCSYYPAIGAVNREEYEQEYWAWRDEIVNTNVTMRCIALRVAREDAMTGAQLRKRSAALVGTRPRTANDAIAAFAGMWYGDNDNSGSKAATKYSDALLGVKRLSESLNDRQQAVFEVDIVPDYHFLLAVNRDKETVAGLLFVPLLAAGSVKPERLKGKRPPMMGVEISDSAILTCLFDLGEMLIHDAGAKAEGVSSNS